MCNHTVLCMNDCRLGLCEALCGHSVDQAFLRCACRRVFDDKTACVSPKALFIANAKNVRFPGCFEAVDYKSPLSDLFHHGIRQTVFLMSFGHSGAKVAAWVRGPASQMYGIHDRKYNENKSLVHFPVQKKKEDHMYRPARKMHDRFVRHAREDPSHSVSRVQNRLGGSGIHSTMNLRATPICIAFEKTSTPRLGWHPYTRIQLHQLGVLESNYSNVLLRWPL